MKTEKQIKTKLDEIMNRLNHESNCYSESMAYIEALLWVLHKDVENL